MVAVPYTRWFFLLCERFSKKWSTFCDRRTITWVVFEPVDNVLVFFVRPSQRIRLIKSQSKRSDSLLPYFLWPCLGKWDTVWSARKETSPWWKLRKDDLVRFQYSFFIATPRVVAVDDPSCALWEVFHFGQHPFAVTVLPTRLELECIHMRFGDGVVAR